MLSERVAYRCIQCGKTCEVTVSYYKRWVNHFCSGKCYYKWRRGKPLSPETCKKVSQKRRGMRFTNEHRINLSKSHSTPDYVKKMRPVGLKARMSQRVIRQSRAERVLLEFIQREALPYVYNGDGRTWIGNKNPDFMHTEKQIVLEVFGKATHTPGYGFYKYHTLSYHQTKEGTLAHYKQHGYDCLIVWDYDIIKRTHDGYEVLDLTKIKNTLEGGK